MHEPNKGERYCVYTTPKGNRIAKQDTHHQAHAQGQAGDADVLGEEEPPGVAGLEDHSLSLSKRKRHTQSLLLALPSLSRYSASR